MKKVFVIVVAFVILVLLGVAVWWFKSSSRADRVGSVGPMLKLTNFSVKEMTPDAIIGDMRVHLSNTFPVTINADSLQYELFIDSSRIMKENYPKSLEIKKDSTLTIKLPVKFEYAKFKKAVRGHDQKGKDSADYTFVSKFQTKVPIIGQREFTMRFSKRLPMLKPITVSLGKFDLEKLGLKKTSFGLDVIVKNDNIFPIRINNGRFSVQVEKDMHMEGDLKDHIDIPAQGSVQVPLHADIKLGKLPRLGWQMLFKKSTTNYAFDFTGKIESKHDIINNSLIHMTSKGTMDDMKDMMKLMKK